MFSQKVVKQKTKWFNENLVAIPRGNTGNCGMCIFCGNRSYCLKMCCMYMDNHFNIETFYWRPADNGKYSWNWPELSDFFDSTETHDIKDMSYVVMEKVFEKNKRSK